RRGMTSPALMGHASHYLPGTEDPAALQALLTVVTQVLDLGVGGAHFDAPVQRFRLRLPGAVGRGPRVTGRRHQVDLACGCEGREGRQGEGRPWAGLSQEVEDFLREEGEGGGGV